MSWSSGKDSAFALFRLLRNPEVNVTGLLTTFNETHKRVAMHAVRESLVIEQAKKLNLELHSIHIPYGCSNELYEARWHDKMREALRLGVTHIAFGDLFLEDIKTYRENLFKGNKIEPLFPIWKMPTSVVAREMIDIGQEAIITCVDPKQLCSSFAGRQFDHSFVDDLPISVDPCGENGEFHSFVYDSPLFQSPIPVRRGETIQRDGFIFSDISISEVFSKVRD